MTRIVHFSDWHGGRIRLPEADVYVCTGDMLPNFPELLYWSANGLETHSWRANMHLLGESSPEPDVDFIGRRFDRDMEKSLQDRWIREVLGGYRRYFDSPDAPVVCVRGNHDFTDLAPAFGGEVYELVEPEDTVTLQGLKFGGMRGVPWITGEWADEMSDDDAFNPARGRIWGRMDELVARLPRDLHVLVTHGPARGMLDSYPLFEASFQSHYGSLKLYDYIVSCMYGYGRLKAHLFGHVHEAHGKKYQGELLLSNAATTHNVFDI